MEVREFVIRRDIGYIASFDPKDAELVQKFMDRINIQEYRIQSLFDKLDRVYDDHKVNLYGKPFEPINMAKSGNKIVNEGLVALAAYQVGKRTKRFDFYAIGESSQAVNIRDDHLYDEVTRLRISDGGGTFIQRQSTIFYSLFFPKTLQDCTVSETGIVDSGDPVNDTMLLRTVVPTIDRIPHKKNFDLVFVAHVIFSGSV